MDDSESTEDLLARARQGDEQAWRALVDRFAALVHGVARGCGLSAADQDEVVSTVWLRLVEHLHRLRDPRALPGWIRTTTRNEAMRVHALRKRAVVVGPDDGPDLPAELPDPDEGLMRAELRHALREAFAGLSSRERGLMLLLLVDPPLSYTEIARQLSIPRGSIGPTRGRCLLKLRGSEALRLLADPEADPGEDPHS